MRFKKKSHKFESEVHLGLLAIVFLLVVLNFMTNVVVYKGRTHSREETLARLNTSAVAISRSVQNAYPAPLSPTELDYLKSTYELSSLVIVPSRPEESDRETRRKWFMSIARHLPAGQLPDLADKLLIADFQQVTRGEGDEYFYVYPIPAGAGHNLLITSTTNPTLAFLDSSGTVILVVSLVVMFAVIIIYALVSKFVLSPYRKIRETAREAGRTLESDSGDVDVVSEYRRIIEELKENETKLIELNQRVTARADSLEHFNEYLLSSIDSGMITIDNSGKVLSINKAAGEMLNEDPAAHAGSTFDILFRSSGVLRKLISQAIKDNRKVGYRALRYRNGDDIDRIFGVTISQILDNNQNRIGFSVLMNDLSELHRLRTELEKKQRLAAMGEMAGGIAHQLRNALGTIGGYGSLVKKRLIKASQETSGIDSLIHEATEAEGLIRQFLDFTHPFRLTPAEVTISELIEDIVSSLRVRDEYGKIEFAVENSVAEPVTLDSLLFKQALSNIVENAANAYDQDNGVVAITTAIKSQSLVITVTDFGCGISREDQDKIYTPFFSLRPSGTGLGLPLASKVIDLHGGRIDLNSELGRGTQFILSIPMNLAHDTAAEKAELFI